MRLTRRDERGQSLSALVAVVLVALFLITGLVVDGGRQVAATRSAEAGAAQAARAASDHHAVSRASGTPPHLGETRAVALRALAERQLTGDVELVAGEVRVRAKASSPTVFLSVIGIGTVHGTGEATAALYT